MNKVNLFFVCLFFVFYLISCSSIDLPKVKQSEEAITNYKLKLDESEGIISSKMPALQSGKDAIVNISLAPLNRMMQILANNRADDINLYFGYSPNIMKEDKNILGLNHTNYVNVDSGMVILNLKSLKINTFENGKLSGNIEIEGSGKIAVNGKYAGIPARVSPDVQLYLNEPLVFDISVNESGNLTLKPRPKKLMLKTKISIKLLQWNVPWYQEIPLEISEILKPISFPIAMKPEIMFPKPADKSGEQKMQNEPYILEFTGSSVIGLQSKLQYRTNINFIKK